MLTPGLVRKGMTITLTIGLFTMAGLLFSSTTPATWRSLTMIHPKNICIMLGVVILSWLVEGWRVKTIAYLLGEQIGFIDTLRINLATIFSGNITPLYSGSVPTQVYLLHQQGLSIGKASAIVTIRVTFTSLLVSIGGPLLLYIFRGKFLDEIGSGGSGRISQLYHTWCLDLCRCSPSPALPAGQGDISDQKVFPP